MPRYFFRLAGLLLLCSANAFSSEPATQAFEDPKGDLVRISSEHEYFDVTKIEFTRKSQRKLEVKIYMADDFPRELDFYSVEFNLFIDLDGSTDTGRLKFGDSIGVDFMAEVERFSSEDKLAGDIDIYGHLGYEYKIEVDDFRIRDNWINMVVECNGFKDHPTPKIALGIEIDSKNVDWMQPVEVKL